METALRGALAAALRARDAVAVSALRSALAALDNAAAPPARSTSTAGGRIAGALPGVGATEVPRPALSDARRAEVLAAEVDERRAAAAVAAAHGRADRAERLRAEAAVLARLLPGT